VDFTCKIYRKLLDALKNERYQFITFGKWLEKFKLFKVEKSLRVVVLRHDVDTKPENSLRMAEIEKELGVNGTYYFRTVPQSFDEKIILKIFDLGNEIGYHYENINTVMSNVKYQTLSEENQNEILKLAYSDFVENLGKFRKLVPVNTICMHGSPRSKYDNKMLWEKYDYKELGIIGEPYFDVDWNRMGYLTDTGRKWNGSNVSVRDKVNSKFKFNFKSTPDIIRNIEKLPNLLMFTIHPERWNDKPLPWVKELVFQNVKNFIKGRIVKSQVMSDE